MLIKSLAKIFLGFLVLWTYAFSYADTTNFEIEVSPKTAWVWEALDITVKAVDADGNVDKSYAWQILIFSQSDPKAEFPWVLKENTYQFKTSDQGQVKFENAVKFTKAWTQDINVFDVSNEDVFWSVEVTIWEWTSTTTTSSWSWEIKITSPITWTTIWTWSLKVNWETLKNYKVVVSVNDKQKFETISDSSWKFEVELTGIASGESSIKAEVFDADNKSLWTSDAVLIKVEWWAPSFKEIKLTPESDIESEQVLEVEVTATPGLTDVNVIINDVMQKLVETEKAWVYTWSITAPLEEWNYKIDVVLKNELWIETKETAAKEIFVKAIELDAASASGTEISCGDLAKDLVIKNVKLTKMKTKSVLSWDKIDKASSYNVYKKNKTTWELELVQNVTEPRIEINISWNMVEYDDFAVKAVLSDAKCNNVESSNTSEMTKVQTGPKEIALVLIALLTWAWVLYFKRRRFS